MDFHSYQAEALLSDQVPEGDSTLVVALLGLAGEAGELLSEYKKELRDGPANQLHDDRVAEELGDLLWYIAKVASVYSLGLDEIARRNLAKIRDRWRRDLPVESQAFDATFPDGQRIPRRFEVVLKDNPGGQSRVQPVLAGVEFGARLTDNAYEEDGYRFHDVLHLAFAAVLGWSPVTRALLRECSPNKTTLPFKRKDDQQADEVEDGGRAAAVEEGIAAMVFTYAMDHKFLEGVDTLDMTILRTIKGMTRLFEVKACRSTQWQDAILQGFVAWRELSKNGGGRVLVDLDARTIKYLGVD